MKRRSFIGILAAAFSAPKLPEAPSDIGRFRGTLRLIADEMNEPPGFDPVNYVGDFRWVNLGYTPFRPGTFGGPLASHETTGEDDPTGTAQLCERPQGDDPHPSG